MSAFCWPQKAYHSVVFGEFFWSTVVKSRVAESESQEVGGFWVESESDSENTGSRSCIFYPTPTPEACRITFTSNV